MKTLIALIVLALAAFVLVVGTFQSANAQEAPADDPTSFEARLHRLEVDVADLYDTDNTQFDYIKEFQAALRGNALKTACDISALKAVREGYAVSYCRRALPDEEKGNVIVVTAVIKLKGVGKFLTRTSLMRAPFLLEDWQVTPG